MGQAQPGLANWNEGNQTNPRKKTKQTRKKEQGTSAPPPSVAFSRLLSAIARSPASSTMRQSAASLALSRPSPSSTPTTTTTKPIARVRHRIRALFAIALQSSTSRRHSLIYQCTNANRAFPFVTSMVISCERSTKGNSDEPLRQTLKTTTTSHNSNEPKGKQIETLNIIHLFRFQFILH